MLRNYNFLFLGVDENKKPNRLLYWALSAESEGFEPPEV